MKRILMVGVAAGALLAGVNLAAAQGAMERQQGGANIEQKGSAQKSGDVKAQGNTELKGGAELKGGKSAQGDELKGSKSRAQAPASDQMKAQDQKSGDQMKGEKGKNAPSKDLKGSAQGDVKAGGSATTTGQAGGSAKASLSTEQRTKIRDTVFKSGPRATNINFSISVGTVVPRSVHFAPLPPLLVEVYPQYRGYEYFIAEDEIIIVEPRTLKIVEVVII